MNKLIAIAALLCAGAAQAQLSYTGGSFQTFANYDPAGTGDSSNVDTSAQSTGWRDATIVTGLGGELTATYLGRAAAHNNAFFVGGAQLFTSYGSGVGAQSAVSVGPGTLDWLFKDLSDDTTVTNGGNGNNNSVHGSFVILGNQAGNAFSPYTKLGQFDLVIAFNDGGRVDADYDDMVIGLNLAPVPEPETYALMLAGLAAVGFAVRRRARRA